MILPLSLNNTCPKRSEQFKQNSQIFNDTGLKRSEQFDTNNLNDQQSVAMILPLSLNNTGPKQSEQFEQDNQTPNNTGLKRSEKYGTNNCNDQQSPPMWRNQSASLKQSGLKHSKQFVIFFARRSCKYLKVPAANQQQTIILRLRNIRFLRNSKLIDHDANKLEFSNCISLTFKKSKRRIEESEVTQERQQTHPFQQS